ncbi:MAG: hypothetical protein IKT23_02630, partial [Clostridia bacterium]|nr:hypothetical protein [Clostridia bacterium]
EAQTDRNGHPVLHGFNVPCPDVPYMVPTDAFADYLISKIKPAIDEGVNDIHMEEPEFWAHSGYSDAFRREYRIYYGEDWQPPHTDVNAYYRCAKLKSVLYTRVIGRIAHALKDYALREYGRALKFYVPTHSLINYTQYGIVSPESALLDEPWVDGYIAQVWTDTSRVRNVYMGRESERIFETAFLEYGVMQELTRGTGRRMWLLQDPIEDKPDENWDYYRASYLKGLTAALLQPEVCRYEICPWPRRIWCGKYPKNEYGVSLPKSYETTLLCIGQALRDMDQPYEWIGGCEGVGVLIADSCLFQRLCPSGPETGNKYAEKGKEHLFSGFYGLALPLLKCGIRVLPVQMDNIARFPDYLSPYRLLVLSYEFMKPESPAWHLTLALWVLSGGTLVVVSDMSDVFHAVSGWWKTQGYLNAYEHLFVTLGLDKDLAPGFYSIGRGNVIFIREHPAALAYDSEKAKSYIESTVNAMHAAGIEHSFKNYFALKRGPYLIAHVLDGVSGGPFTVDGRFVDLFDPGLVVRNGICLKPGQSILAADIDAYAPVFCLICGAGRVENYVFDNGVCTFTVKGPKGSRLVLRFKSPWPALVQGAETYEYDPFSGTLLLRLTGCDDGKAVRIEL